VPSFDLDRLQQDVDDIFHLKHWSEARCDRLQTARGMLSLL
jgi:hypothetical protein